MPFLTLYCRNQTSRLKQDEKVKQRFLPIKMNTNHQFLRPLKQETYCDVHGSTGHIAIRGEILRENPVNWQFKTKDENEEVRLYNSILLSKTTTFKMLDILDDKTCCFYSFQMIRLIMLESLHVVGCLQMYCEIAC